MPRGDGKDREGSVSRSLGLLVLLLLQVVPVAALAQDEEQRRGNRSGSRIERATREQRGEAALEAIRERQVYYRGDGLFRIPTDDGVVLLITGEVVLESRVFSLSARNVAIWLREPEEEEEEPERSGREDRLEATGDYASFLAIDRIREIYADEQILLELGNEVFRADRLLYDLEENRALLVHGSMKAYTELRGRRVPLYVRAEELVRKGDRLLVGRNAFVSNCGFGTEVFHLRASEVDIVLPERPDATPGEETREDDPAAPPGEGTEEERARFRVRKAVVSSWGVPLFYLPSFRGRSGGHEGFYFQRARAGRTSQFGAFLLTEWGDRIRVGERGDRRRIGEWTVHVDPLEKRGVGVGLDVDYKARTGYGRFRSYYIHDEEDFDTRGSSRDPQTGRRTDIPIDEADRGRFRLQYRHFLPLDIEGTVEYSWLSDSNFLREYFEKEFKVGKDQETVLYLKRVFGEDQAFTLLQKNRVNDFLEQTEYLPQGDYRVIEKPLLPKLFLGTNLYYSSRTSVANIRQRPSSEGPVIPDIDQTRITRFDTRHRLSVPFDLGPTVVRPFFESGVGTFSEDRSGEGPTHRFTAAAGATWSTQIHRAFRARSPLLRVDGLRHIVNPLLSYVNRYANTVGSDELIPHDEIEDLDKVEFFRIQVRQRVQTRGERDVVDLVDFDSAINVFVDENRDNQRRTLGNLENDLLLRPSRRARIFFESEYNFDEDQFDILNTGFQTQPVDWVRIQLAYRKNLRRSRILAGGARLDFSEKYSIDLFQRFDLEADEVQDLGLTVERRTCDWVFGFTLQRDEGDRDTRLSVTVTPRALFRRKSRRRGIFQDENPFRYGERSFPFEEGEVEPYEEEEVD